ncbi:MAG: O-antigen ligase family protein [Chloroflexi bacterium OHK40]
MKPPPAARLALLLMLNALILAAMAAVVWLDNAANRGITFTPGPEPIPHAGGPVVGVNLFNIHLEPDPEAVRRSFELAAGMGARFARMQVPWDDIEIHARGDFEDRRNLEAVGAISAWSKYDRIVAEANAAGVALIMRLERPPAWARAVANATPEFQAGLLRDGNSTGPPDNLADYGRFVATVVERYDGDGQDDAPGSPTVRHFQLWNEPNLKNEWGWQEPRPEAFVELLRVGATAAREASPAAVILFPGLAPTDGLDDRAPMTELEYLDRVYKAGGAAYFDVMAAQSYGLGQPPDEHRYVFLRGRDNWNWRRPVDTRNDVGRVVLLREVMEANGDGGTAVWVTEFGWNSAPEHIPPERRFTWGAPVSEEQKGAYLVGQLQRARDEWPWMGVMNVWMLRYGGFAEPDPADPTPYFALVSRDWQLLPAYEALRSFTAAPAVAGVGAHLWSHPAVEPFDSGWRVRFSGTSISLVGGLEGVSAATLDGAPVTLARDNVAGRQVLSAPALPDGEHLLEVRGGPAPERLIVARARPLGWLWDYGPLALVAALALSAGATFATLFPTLDGLAARLAAAQARARGSPRLAARLIQPQSLILIGMLLGAVVAYRASAQLPLTLAGLALFGGLAFVRPELALLFVPLTVPLYFIPKGLFDARFGIRDSGIYLPLHELLLLIALGAATARWAWVETRRRMRTRPVLTDLWRLATHLAPVWLFLAAGFWGALIAEVRGPALRELRWLIIEPLLFAGLLLLVSRREQTDAPQQADQAPWTTGYERQALIFWLVGGAVAGLVGVLQFLGLNLAPLFGTKAGFSEDSFLVEGVRRVSGLYGHPNNLGLAMGRYWPVAAALAHGAFWGAPSRHEGLRRAAPWLAITALCLGGLLVSFSRGAYLGAAAAIAVLAAWLLPPGLWRDRRVLGALGVLGALATVAALAIVALGVERFNPFGASSAIRLQTWASALAMLRDHPLGIGLDQFGQLYPRYIAPELAGTNEINTAHPHNLLLDIALRMGPPGLLAFAWLIMRFYHENRRGAALSPRAAPLRAGLAAAMAAALVHGLVDQFYFWPDLAFAFWLLLILARSESAPARRNR